MPEQSREPRPLVAGKQAIKNALVALALILAATALYLKMQRDHGDVTGNSLHAHVDTQKRDHRDSYVNETLISELDESRRFHGQRKEKDNAAYDPNSRSDSVGGRGNDYIDPAAPISDSSSGSIPNSNSESRSLPREVTKGYNVTVAMDDNQPDKECTVDVDDAIARAAADQATSTTRQQDEIKRGDALAPEINGVKIQRADGISDHDHPIVPASAVYSDGSSGTSTSRPSEFDTLDRPSGSSPIANRNLDPRWPLSPLEQKMYAATESIRNAPQSTWLHGVRLNPSLYHNVSRFIKSYELMEEMFRVYVYKEGRGPLVHTGPVLGIYASEGLFIRQMEQWSGGAHPFLAASPAQALAFFLPFSVANMVDVLYEPGSTSMHRLTAFIDRYIHRIAAAHPFWNRTQGSDHFFVACHDWGPLVMQELVELKSNVMKVVCNADKEGDFRYGRDASLPEFYMHEEMKEEGEKPRKQQRGQRRTAESVAPPPTPPVEGEERTTLAFFAGQMHGRVRPRLVELWQYPKGGEEMQIYGAPAQKQQNESSMVEMKYTYEEQMRKSKFCICAAGYEVNSPRIVEAVEAGCVPVIIADGFVLPFSDVLDWSAFSVTLPESRLPFLKSDLLAVTESQYAAMRRRLPHLLMHFSWHSPRPRPFDVFHMVLHSVWSARLLNLTQTQPNPS